MDMHMLPFKLLNSLFPASPENRVTIPAVLFRFLLSEAARHTKLDEEDYMRCNPDVALAIRQGLWASARDHYAKNGYFEGRTGTGMMVSESWYLKTNPDVAKAVKDGAWKSAEDHYFRQGLFEWRIPNKDLQDDITAWKHMVSEP
ncbi:hypothetical protein ACELLULO517_06005 [Acidisoma cellulosilytica]|uniref:Uncharacterized protein n=1 Tax=Acidisoma cellulosilyticum TaxID=2802395 RepID=A0A964E2M6_9PROT|nr:hypothetical protein [Acidisoma cellulosilyticum]MCB8879780.1 hypothetical protein [Acidisoma cellulosilyticum]